MVVQEEPWPEGSPAWVELVTPDHELAVRFYSDVFDWRIVPGPPQYGRYGFALVDGRPTAGIGAASTGSAVWTTYLSVDNVRRTSTQVRENGGQVLTPPAAIGTQGSSALVADPAGGVVGLWQAAAHIGTQVIDEPGALCWSELLSSAPGTAREFYTALFQHQHHEAPGGADYTMTAPPQPYTRAIAGIGRLPEGEDAGWAGELSFWMTFFAVDDVESTAERIREGGGRVLAGPRRTPYGRAAVCADPSGARFTVIRLPRRR